MRAPLSLQTCLHRRGAEWYEVKEIVSGMALATGISEQCFPMRNRRLAPCRSLRQGLISHHSARGRWGTGKVALPSSTASNEATLRKTA